MQLYKARLSGPLLDRIDMHVEVPAVSARELTRGIGRSMQGDRAPVERTARPSAETSVAVRARVAAARELQSRRLAGHRGGRGDGMHCNALMGITEIEEFCRLDDATRAFLQKAMESYALSARAAHRVLRVARTIADLEEAVEVCFAHLAEALQYRAWDRGGDAD